MQPKKSEGSLDDLISVEHPQLKMVVSKADPIEFPKAHKKVHNFQSHRNS